jgi:hypothetical protein
MSRNVTAETSRPAGGRDPLCSMDAVADKAACSEAVTHRAQMQALPRANDGTAARSSALKLARAHQHGDSFDVDAAMAHRFGSPQSGHEAAQVAFAAFARNPCTASVPSRIRRA